jgi:hypothetical protein
MDELRAVAEKAIARAFSLGQTYWQQADSESYAQNRKSDETLARYRALMEETLALFAALSPSERQEAAAAMTLEQAKRVIAEYEGVIRALTSDAEREAAAAGQGERDLSAVLPQWNVSQKDGGLVVSKPGLGGVWVKHDDQHSIAAAVLHALAQDIQAARASLPASPSQGQWQTMSSAPRDDGTRFIGLTKGRRAVTAVPSYCVYGNGPEFRGWNEEERGSFVSVDLIGWMPLPATPSQPSQGNTQ